jgi:hypothetical protein
MTGSENTDIPAFTINTPLKPANCSSESEKAEIAL